ncbi:MAG TPA: ABC transporter permease [Gemmatimonadales bacterium]
MMHWTDIRDAARSLARAPALALSATLCLALGLGATTAIYSAIDRALLQPLPFPEPERLVSVFRTTPHFNNGPFSAPNYTDLSIGRRSLTGLAAATPTTALISMPDAGLQEPAFQVTGNFFPVLGASAALGRLLGDADTAAAAPATVVVGYDLWRTRFGGDSSLVGRTILVDGDARTVVGVAPPDFRLSHGGQQIQAALWLPLVFSANQLQDRRSNYLYVIGRLARGATTAGADAELKTAFAGIVRNFPLLNGDQVQVLPVQQEGTRAVRTPLLLVMGAVGCVLLVAVANVASLLLARGVQRRREMAIRTALGGGRWAVIRPVAAESLLLAFAGAALGLGLAEVGVKTIGRLAGERLPQLNGLGIDMRVIGFALLLTVIVSVLCSAVPAWSAAAADPQDALRGGTGGGPGRQHHRALGGLVIAELALSVVLLLAAGLVLKGFAHLMAKDPGFETPHLLTLEVTVSPAGYPKGTSQQRFLDPALAAIRQVPGVREAGAITLVPYVNWGWNFNIRYEGVPGDNPAKLPITEWRAVTAEFFPAMGQRLIAGRLLQASDDARPGAPAVMVVNQALVQRDFHGGDAIGKRLYWNGDTSFATIVGVVSDIRNFGPVEDPRPEVYQSWSQSNSWASVFPLVVRTTGDPASVARAVEAAIHGVDRAAAVSKVMPMADVIGQSVGRPKFYLTLLAVFAGVAVVLAIAGLYGVLGYVVAQRTREIGIRTALGSPAGTTIALIARRGLGLVAGGLVVGMAGGVLMTRLLTNLLYGVSPLDPRTWLLVAGGLGVTGLLAALIPARRATRVDPLVALRGS